MNKNYYLIEKIIDFIALIVVLYHFLHFVNIIPFEIKSFVFLDYLIIVVLALDFIYRYQRAENKKTFLKESWIELLSLIPFSGFFRAFRVFRIIKKSKFASFFKFAHTLLKSSGLYYVIFVVLLLAFVGGGLLMHTESSITTFEEGIWFSFVTMTTVGYGDFVPVTSTGRWISIFLMILGIGFLSVLSGSIASYLVRVRRTNKIKHEGSLQVDLSDLSSSNRKEVLSYIDYIRNKQRKG